MKGNRDPIEIHIYDLEQAFDAMWLDECLNDLYDTLPEENRNEKIALLYESNKDNLVAVNTAVGLRERRNIHKIVQQGGTWGPILCSNTIDTLGEKCRDRGENFYMYKNTVKVIPLAMVDDLIGTTKCGIQAP